MRDTVGPPLKAAALLAFLVGLVMLLLNPPSFGGVGDLLALLAGFAAVALLTAWVTVLLLGDEMPEPEFRRIVERSEALANAPVSRRRASEFDELVVEAIDELPEEMREIVAGIPIIVSPLGHEYGAYGHYIGDTAARDGYPDQIVIYQDTLERDFGHDPDRLRAEVARTVRHELAHHIGWDEPGVRGLGL